MEDIMVTIVCLTYNSEKYIRAALNGFVMQETDFRYEILIHDDASTDGTVEILKEYKEKYPNMFVLMLEEENQYSKYETFIYMWEYVYQKARGKYIAMCEGDDEWIYGRKLQEQFDFMENNTNVSMYLHNALRIDARTGETILQINGKESGYMSDDEMIRSPYGAVPTASFFFRKDCVENIPGFIYRAPVADDPIRHLCMLYGEIYYKNDVWSVRNFMHDESWNSKMHNNPMENISRFSRYACYLAEFNDYSQKRFEIYIKDSIVGFCENIISMQAKVHQGIKDEEFRKIMEKCKEEQNHKIDDAFDAAYQRFCIRSARQDEAYLDKVMRELASAKTSGKLVFIYGVGKEAEEKYSKLGDLAEDIDGFVVSHNAGVTEFKEHKVYELNDLTGDRENVFFWLCMNVRNTLEVIENLYNKGFNEYLI